MLFRQRNEAEARGMRDRRDGHAPIRAMLRHRRREWISTTAYACAIPLAFVSPWLSYLLYVAIAVLWFLPDRRIETELAGRIPTTGGKQP